MLNNSSLTKSNSASSSHDEAIKSIKKQSEHLEQMIARHAIHVFFDVTIAQSYSRKVVLALKLRDEFAAKSQLIQGLLASVIDCAVSVASYASLNEVTIAEAETNFFPAVLTDEFMVRVEIESVTHPYASYSCEIYRQERRTREKMAESQGTLIMKNPLLSDAPNKKPVHRMNNVTSLNVM